MRSVRREVAVELNELTKSYPLRRRWIDLLRDPRGGKRVTAVDHLSFSVNEGEFFGLLGPNGAGKTTVFKMLSTLILPDSGEAKIQGHDLVRDESYVRSALCPVIADERSLNWRISARENLRFYATLYGLRGRVLSDTVAELLELVGLSEADHKIVGAFSSGMKQRLLLARSLLSSPRVLLLDEPTRSLDPVAARQFRTFLREDIVGRRGCTVLLATHNSEEALELCDRVMILNRGRSVAIGKPDELVRDSLGERYRAWIRFPPQSVLTDLHSSSVVSRISTETEGDWTVIEMAITGGERQAAMVLETLVREGAGIGRFEKVRLPLADLIEALLAREGNHGG
jgi:ABC-2 type transport system ATP-binding protein